MQSFKEVTGCACVEQSFVRTGYNTDGRFLFVWVFFPFFFAPPQERRKLQYLTKLVKCFFLACISYYTEATSHNKLKIAGEINFLLLIFFLKQKAINSVL